MPNGHWLTPYGEVTQHGVGPTTYGAFGAGMPGGGLVPIIPTTTQAAPWQATWEAGQAPWSTATTASSSGTYVVQPGDTLWAISRQFGTTVQAIAAANGIANPNLIYPGQQLIIPGVGGGAPPAQQPPAGGGGGAAPPAGGGGVAGGGPPPAGGAYWSGPLPTPPTGDYWTYTLQWGDTLWSLAQRYGTTVEELARLNQIPDPNRIAAGAQIYIPGAAPPGTPPGGGGGGAPPEEQPAVPSWWGAEVFGEEGWVYLPTTPGEQPTQWQAGEGEYTAPPVGPGWYNLRGVEYFNQLPPQWRDWLGQVMQSQQEYWESPTIAPIQWMPSTAAYQRAPLHVWEPLAGGTAGGQHAMQPPGTPYAPPGMQRIEEEVWEEPPEESPPTYAGGGLYVY